MVSVGYFDDCGKRYDLIVKHDEETEVILLQDGRVYSAYKKTPDGQFYYNNLKAKQVWGILNDGLRGCTAKNGFAVPFELGVLSRHKFKRMNREYVVDKFGSSLANAHIHSDGLEIQLEYTTKPVDVGNIPYVKSAVKSEFALDREYDVPVRSLEEIALEKDLSWLKDKKYYIVNDDEVAEKIFTFLENYNGPISYDTETTGLRINMFGKVNSIWQKMLKAYNDAVDEKDSIEVDRLVGFIFCVEPNVAYYFPVANRKFKNLYEDVNSPVRKEVIKRIRERKLKDDPNCITDMARLFRDTPDDQLTPDVIAMERIRDILEKKHIVAHNGSFEWKVGWLYEIDTNLCDDTMVLHQLLYKFRSTTSNKGEPSNLKYLERREFGIDSLELSDFFVGYKEDDGGIIRGKKGKNKVKIDFSYMDYEGARAYAPADGDWTLQLYFKYKRDLLENYKELEYLYNVEVIVACAVGYMEFYGHRIDESKIQETRDKLMQKMKDIENEIKQMAGISEINLASPAQVANLFYDIMKIPCAGDKRSVSKSAIKPLLQMKNEDGSVKYPVVHLYSEWKKVDTLLVKFFDNLQNYMYPGGYIFSQYGQIATATGRMNCRNPNAQQYPKDVTAIVVPRPGYVMMDCDFSQIEYRVLVALAKEKNLLEKFEDPDMDYHTMMASLMFGVPYASVTPKMRSEAKSFNFGIPYGMGFKSLALLLTGMAGPEQIEEAKQKYELYFKDQPNVRKFFRDVKEMALINKYTKTFWNRRRYYSFTDENGRVSEAKKASALRQAGNAVIQGTAADIFKIAIARIFMYIRRWRLFGHLLIINMIHDELLLEVNCHTLNPQRVLKDVADCMQFKVEGFPPLFIGAGFGMNWLDAKGKLAEIHPHLCDILSKEVENESVYAKVPQEPEDVVKYFDKRIHEFNEKKVIDYLTDPRNWGHDLHPVIGNILNLRFAQGFEDSGLEGEELTLAILKKFIEEHNLNVDPNSFKAASHQGKQEDDDEDKEYDEVDEEAEDAQIMDIDFALIDEDESLYGVSMQDVISMFGLIVSKERKVCGIDTRILTKNKLDELAEYLTKYVCEPTDEGAMEIVFLKEHNVLLRTGVWVRGVDGSAIAARLRINTLLYR